MAEDNTIKLDLSQHQEPTPEVQAEEPVTEQVEEAVVEPVKEEPVAEETPKETPKNDAGDYVLNFDLPKPEEDAVQQVQGETEEGVLRDERVEDANEENPKEEESPVIEIVDEKTDEEEVKEEAPNVDAILKEEEAKASNLPEGMDKLVEFMNDTGLQGPDALQAYLKLNQDVDQLDPSSAVFEYYKNTKPYLTDAQITKQLQNKFGYDQESADPDEIENKNIAFQEELYKAKQHLSEQKDKYYADLKLRQQSQLPEDAQEAVKFYSEYQQQVESNEKLNKAIIAQTQQVFSDDFKGFDFKVGESKFRYKVNDVAKQKEQHMDVTNIFNKFYDAESGALSDAVGYHKALFAAQNSDKLAQHFYEQGRADAIKESAKKSKNIDMGARADNSAITTPSGKTVRVVSGDSGPSIKNKMKIPGWNN